MRPHTDGGRQKDMGPGSRCPSCSTTTTTTTVCTIVGSTATGTCCWLLLGTLRYIPSHCILVYTVVQVVQCRCASPNGNGCGGGLRTFLVLK